MGIGEITNLALSCLMLFLLIRFGLVGLVVFWFAAMILKSDLITLDASAWYSGYGFAMLAIFIAVVLYAFRTSLGGRQFLAPSHLDD